MSQWLGYKDSVIVAAANTRYELENSPLIVFDNIVKTEDKYVLIKGKYVLETKSHNDKVIAARLAEYPSIEDQLDMIYWDRVNNTNVWENTITRIKKHYPKD